mmetsp:Transcript_25264/g.54985  ORF Transcript_25264/g.54985 Transcript_25264/m.54985 type:complete len:100 (-) Transcript_25264:528-827(-)
MLLLRTSSSPPLQGRTPFLTPTFNFMSSFLPSFRTLFSSARRSVHSAAPTLANLPTPPPDLSRGQAGKDPPKTRKNTRKKRMHKENMRGGRYKQRQKDS